MTTLPLDPILARREQVQAIAARSIGRRRAYSKIAVTVCVVLLAVALVPLVAIVVYVVAKGLPAWNVDFFTQVTKPEGIPDGGVWNAIVGTLIIDGIAVAVTVPFGILAGLFLAESDGRIAGTVRFCADVLTGVPSITIGIFAYAVLVKAMGRFSAIAGCFAIGVVMLPVIMRASETAIRGVPATLSEAGLSLGARRATVARKVVLPAALPGLITGVMLAIARGVGETAPLLLTIFGSQFLQVNPFQAMEALPLVIYSNSASPYADLVQIAWGAALLLMVAVLLLNIGSRVAAARLRRERR